MIVPCIEKSSLYVGSVRNWSPGCGELGPDAEREQPGDEEEQERVDQVHDPDLLVIGRRQPLVQGASVGGGGRRQRGGRHRGSLLDRERAGHVRMDRAGEGVGTGRAAPGRRRPFGDAGEDLALEDLGAGRRSLVDGDVVRRPRVLVLEVDVEGRVGRGLSAVCSYATFLALISAVAPRGRRRWARGCRSEPAPLGAGRWPGAARGAPLGAARGAGAGFDDLVGQPRVEVGGRTARGPRTA